MADLDKSTMEQLLHHMANAIPYQLRPSKPIRIYDNRPLTEEEQAAIDQIAAELNNSPADGQNGWPEDFWP